MSYTNDKLPGTHRSHLTRTRKRWLDASKIISSLSLFKLCLERTTTDRIQQISCGQTHVNMPQAPTIVMYIGINNILQNKPSIWHVMNCYRMYKKINSYLSQTRTVKAPRFFATICLRCH